MKCKYCGAELAHWGGFCPVCGKNNAEEEQTELVQEPLIQAEACEIADDAHALKLKKAKRIAAMSGCVALLAVLATVLFFGIRGGWDVGALFSWLQPKEEEIRENNLQYKDSYTVTDKHALIKRDLVVATLGDLELTNAELQIYYWTGVFDFLDQNYYYLSYIGLDYSKPLNEQTCYFDSTITWQQHFLKNAINTWNSNAALAQLAKEKGFSLPEEYRKELDALPAELQTQATKNGYETVDAMVQESFGYGVTLAHYQAYMETYYLGYAYFESLYEQINPSAEEIEEYYAANEEALNGQGIKKDGSYTVDVRHILVMMDKVVADMEKNEGGADAQTETDKKEEDKYTEEQWAACLAAAQQIYDEWLAGDMTEKHFGELANKYSHDKDGKVTDGGIYTFVEEGDMLEDFNSWCFEEGRKPGDTGIVKTKYGYHVMYFVGSEETWFTRTRSAYISAKSDEIVENALAQYTIAVDYTRIVLTNMEL